MSQFMIISRGQDKILKVFLIGIFSSSLMFLSRYIKKKDIVNGLCKLLMRCFRGNL